MTCRQEPQPRSAMPSRSKAQERGVRRTRGERAGLDIKTIIEAARTLEPEAITMQAVADPLGVDRSALNYYVTGRNALLELVAADAFSTHASQIEVPSDDGWQAACRAYAR